AQESNLALLTYQVSVLADELAAPIVN
ncbi:MAG: hypothetical protein ACD_57C00349G0001, partial [uncultured bacterium]